MQIIQQNLCKTATLKKTEILVFRLLMQVKSIAECSKNATILPTFIKLPFVIKTFVLSILEWLFYTGFTVYFLLLT